MVMCFFSNGIFASIYNQHHSMDTEYSLLHIGDIIHLAYCLIQQQINK